MNEEARMSNDEGMTKLNWRAAALFRLASEFVVRHSSFVISADCRRFA
jgi:hypothetical protein